MDRPWLRHYDEGVPATIDYPKVPIDRLLAQSASGHPDHAALIFGARVGSRLLESAMTYRELDEAVNRFASGLKRLDVGRGDRVVVMLPNCPQFIIAAYACWRIGAILVCCNPLYVEREVEQLINDSGAATFIVMSSLYGRIRAVRPNTCLERVIVTNIKEYFPGLLKLLFTLTKEKKQGHRVDIGDDEGTYWFQDVLQKPGSTPEPVEIDPGDVAALVYTGGTTGGPKGAQLTHRNLVSNAIAMNVWAQSREGVDIIISVMPFFHIYGLTVGVNTAIVNALTAVLLPDPRDLLHALAAIRKHRATFYPAVPTMVAALNNHPRVGEFDLTSLRFAACGAAPLPPEVQARFEEITGCPIVEAYGMTESSPTVCAGPVTHPRPRSIGVPIPDTDMKIVDIETGGTEMPPGEIGEIIVKGPQVMKGYWKQPEATADAIRVGPDGEPGWLYTGDIGSMDEYGYFHIEDRKKDMIIAGGYNIYPAEVEAILFEHPKVLEGAVIGVPDERRGETVKAFVVLREGERATEDEIIQFCRENMAVYKIPRVVEFRDDLPKSLIGKVLRRKLREGSDG
ncbi:MAG: long-chain fatty acid--CoA ligase [Deltaproteobacteria bacterium]|nr:long-chain fatty acid--CoA ligase [Deltaproteobacteria bacterium]